MLYSPMEQYIIFPVLSKNIVINNVIFYLLLAAFLTIILSSGISRGNIISNNWGILSESLYRTILKKIEGFVGRKYLIYLPLFYTIFHLVLFSNFIGLIPYTSTPTVEIVKTLSIAFTLLKGILLIGFLTHQLRLLAIFLPSGVPTFLIPIMVVLEIIAYIFRTISLGLRLAINLITGHILAKVCIGFVWLGYLNGKGIILILPLVLITAFFALEILIAYLQSYILIFITILTLKDISME